METSDPAVSHSGDDWRRVRELLLGEDRIETRDVQDRVTQLETALLELRAAGERRVSLLKYFARPLAICIAVVTALVLLLAGWSSWRHRQVREAVSLCEEIPGMRVIDADLPWWGRARLSGLRDPLGPAAEKVLSDRGIDPGRFDLDFVSYPSADTVWAEKRERHQAKLVEDLRREVIATVGDLDAARETARRRDVETLTRALFALQFPEAEGQIEIALEEARWKVRGNAEGPLYQDLIDRLPNLTLTGEVDTSELRDTSQESLLRLKLEIEEVTLVYLSGSGELSEDGHRQAARLIRLLKQLDDLAHRLEQSPPEVSVHSLPIVGESPANAEIEMSRISDTEKRILKDSGYDPSRIRPGVRDTEEQDGRVGTYVRILPGVSTAATFVR